MYVCIMYVCMYVRMCMCVCMYVCVCVYVCMYVYVCTCMYQCACASNHVCVYVCMYVCMYVCTYVCMYVCVYVYMYVCMPATFIHHPLTSPFLFTHISPQQSVLAIDSYRPLTFENYGIILVTKSIVPGNEDELSS